MKSDMKRIFTSTLLFLALSGTVFVSAQISFRNASARMDITDFHSGVAIGVLDMNSDGLDDIIRLSEAQDLHISYQNARTLTFQTVNVGIISGSRQWSLCAADVDNDGDNDLLSGGAYDGVTLTRSIEGDYQFSNLPLPGNDLFLQGSNLVDINNDGWLDYFACHDDAESRIWRNDSTGHFVPADDWIDMATTPSSDDSGNYGSIWTDIDLDGDLDLYIAKCRQGVNSPSDPRRINALFLNDGNSNFSEQAEAAGLKIGAQSWTADFQDIDNDGDYDCFITNHDVPCQLLENDGNGVFTDITEGSGIQVAGLAVQGVMRDFNNDGYVDILVTGSNHYLFHNNGNHTFTAVDGLFGDDQMESFAIGDLNHDGFLDVYGGYAELYNGPSDIEDVLWLNTTGNGNNFVALQLIGQQSNRSAVGTRVELYGTWGLQVREVRAGESYGIMNSLTQHFGVGTATGVDSLILRWPSGQVDKHYGLPTNQWTTLVEGACASPPVSITVDGSTTICSGDSVAFSASPTEAYVWNTGQTSSDIWANEAGGYYVEASGDSLCTSLSPVVELTVDPNETPTLSANGSLEFCEGGSIQLTSSEAASYLWSTGETTQSITVTDGGSYSVAIEGLCATFDAAPLEVVAFPVPSAPELVDIQYQGDTSAILSVSGQEIYWYNTADDTVAFAQGNVQELPLVDGEAQAFVEDLATYQSPASNVGMAAHDGSDYSGNQYNGAIIFDCFAPFILKEVTVYTDTPGERIIELQDASGEVLHSIPVHIPEGQHTLTLDLEVAPGIDLQLTTSIASNVQTFGFASPRLRRANESVEYPYTVEDLLQIKDSNFGNSRYYYFFDWVVQEPGLGCASDRAIVNAVLPSNTTSLQQGSLRVYPNPASQSIHIVPPPGQGQQLRVWNAQGQLMEAHAIGNGQDSRALNVSLWAEGLYIIQWTAAHGTYSTSFIKR